MEVCEGVEKKQVALHVCCSASDREVHEWEEEEGRERLKGLKAGVKWQKGGGEGDG